MSELEKECDAIQNEGEDSSKKVRFEKARFEVEGKKQKGDTHIRTRHIILLIARRHGRRDGEVAALCSQIQWFDR